MAAYADEVGSRGLLPAGHRRAAEQLRLDRSAVAKQFDSASEIAGLLQGESRLGAVGRSLAAGHGRCPRNRRRFQRMRSPSPLTRQRDRLADRIADCHKVRLSLPRSSCAADRGYEATRPRRSTTNPCRQTRALGGRGRSRSGGTDSRGADCRRRPTTCCGRPATRRRTASPVALLEMRST